MSKCRKIKGIDYEKAGTTAILNVMAEELRELYDSENTFDNIHYMHKMNKKAFKILWGEQSCCWQGSNRNWVWLHELPNTNLFVLVSDRGTSYEFARAKHNQSWDVSTKETLKFLNITLAGLKDLGIHHQ